MKSDRLYYLSQDLDDISHLEQIATAVKAGVQWIQLRSKRLKGRELRLIARQAARLTEGTPSKLIINDHVKLVVESGAHGVHLGKEDMAVKEARSILGSTKVIGGTANSVEDALKIWRQGVDYIGLGPFRYTSTKSGLSPVLGVEKVNAIIEALSLAGVDIPVFAIGGIKGKDIDSLLRTGIYGIAMASAVNLAENRLSAIQLFQSEIHDYETINQNQPIKN